MLRFLLFAGISFAIAGVSSPAPAETSLIPPVPAVIRSPASSPEAKEDWTDDSKVLYCEHSLDIYEIEDWYYFHAVLCYVSRFHPSGRPADYWKRIWS